MGFGFGGGCDFDRCHHRRDDHRKDDHRKDDHRRDDHNPELRQFLRTLTPGTCIVIQFDSQPPTSATFQGFQGNNVIILSDFDCFPGLARIAINKINVVSINSPDCDRFRCKRRRHCNEHHEHKHDHDDDF
ncbi:hypothetical protein [Bacillus proteolyticus]|uniref:hypothetical protein n=1 Tax=Bacillus proteolyticus TaxID=2026192 RepID=UPI003D07DE5D